MFERKWVIFESDIEKIPSWSLIVVSAHGTGPSYFAKLREKNMRWIDATCPLVEKVHREARDFIAKWYHILYIGKKWHQEAVWVMDEGEKNFTLIESEEDIEKLLYTVTWWYTKNGESEWNNLNWWKLALLTQTTLSVDDTAKLIEKIQNVFPDIILPKAWDICYATTNRQKAVKVLTEKVDLVLVVGSKNSSNSSKLRHVAEEMGKIAYLIDGPDDIEQVWFNNCTSIGVTSGASGPEELVEGVVRHLVTLGGMFSEELRVVEEKVEFPYIITIKS
jgi:4-hydroxy-3-methylbut-2-enyl diphosphate reductase